MAFPTILVNSSTGSDTQASGAGPATALFGTTDASTDGAGTTVTLTAGTDLSGVATDGSHVIFLGDSTASARNFSGITGSAGSGGATPTVTVANAFGLSLSGKSWAIGGKRATLADANTKKLVDNNGSSGDAMPGWTIEVETNQTITAEWSLRRSGDTTSGFITFRGASGVMPIITFTNNSNAIYCRGNYLQFSDFELQNSNATKTASIAIQAASVGSVGIRNVLIKDATNKFWKGISWNNPGVLVEGCEIGNTVSSAIISLAGVVIQGNEIYSTGANAIVITGSADGGAIQIKSNVIHNITGDAINIATTGTNATRFNVLLIENNIIDTTSADAIELNIAATQLQALAFMTIQNNILSDIGGYGYNFSGASIGDIVLNALHVRIRNNNIYTVTSGRIFPTTLTVEQDGTSFDPTYVGSGDYTPTNTSLEGTAYPASIP